MSVVKKIVCLAYSRKVGGYCVAGIDLETGAWIRPVSATENGVLTMAQCSVPKSIDRFREPELLDILEIELVEPLPKALQPENWLVSSRPWTAVARLHRSEMHILQARISDDPELFRGYERYVSREEVKAHPPGNSLTLISPRNLHWAAEQDRYGRRRIRGIFSVLDATYSLPLTDDRYASHFSQISISQTVAHVDLLPGPPLLTISLGDLDSVSGRYYKLIAGVVHL